MKISCTTCRQSGRERSNPQPEARCVEPASRNVSELVSAPLDNTGMAKLPIKLKPATHEEEATICIHGVPRGVWRQRVGKEPHRNLGDPLARGGEGKSDDFIVALKSVKADGAKEVCCI
jgi:hypothetical protein